MQSGPSHNHIPNNGLELWVNSDGMFSACHQWKAIPFVFCISCFCLFFHHYGNISIWHTSDWTWTADENDTKTPHTKQLMLLVHVHFILLFLSQKCILTTKWHFLLSINQDQTFNVTLIFFYIYIQWRWDYT